MDSGSEFSMITSKDMRFQLGAKLISSISPISFTVKISESETSIPSESVTDKVRVKSALLLRFGAMTSV